MGTTAIRFLSARSEKPLVAVDLQVPEPARQHAEAGQREQAAHPGAQAKALLLLLAGFLEFEHASARIRRRKIRRRRSVAAACAAQPASGQMATVRPTLTAHCQPGHLPASQARMICVTSWARKNTGSMCMAWLQRSKRCRRRCSAIAP